MSLELEQLSSMLFAALPGIGAAILSIYNFLKARQGAMVNIIPMYQFGFINIERDSIPKKILYLTIPFENAGSAVATISQIKFETYWDNERSVLYPMRRVELTKPDKEQGTLIYQNNFKEVIPLLPISIPPGGGKTFTFEFHDIKKPFPIGKKAKGVLIVTYSQNKKVVYEFPLQISEKLWRASRGNVIYEYVTPPDEPEFVV